MGAEDSTDKADKAATRSTTSKSKAIDHAKLNLSEIRKGMKGIVFSGTGKHPANDLKKFRSRLHVAFLLAAAPPEFSDLLDTSDDGENYDDQLSAYLYGLLHLHTSDLALATVEKHATDGRRAWLALVQEYMPSDALSRNALIANIYTFRLRHGVEPLGQLDDLHDLLDAYSDVVQSFRTLTDIEIQDAYVGALSRSAPEIYGTLVTQLNHDSFVGNAIDVNTIRSLASSAYKTYQAVHGRSPGTGEGRRKTFQPGDDDISLDEENARLLEKKTANVFKKNIARPPGSSGKSCFACKAAGGDYHYPSKCDTIRAALKMYNDQKHGSYEMRKANPVISARTKVVPDYPPSSDDEIDEI